MAAKDSKVHQLHRINLVPVEPVQRLLSSSDPWNLKTGLQFKYRRQHEGSQVHTGMRQIQAL
jgi:hypothetical protein